MIIFFFFFNDTATTEIYTLSLHDALPISADTPNRIDRLRYDNGFHMHGEAARNGAVLHRDRSEEHTSELQSRQYLVCRLLLEKKKIDYYKYKLEMNTLLHAIKHHTKPVLH